MRSSVVKAENFAVTTSQTSLYSFLFPVTFANSLLSAFTNRKFFNKRATVLLEHNQQLSERLLQIRLLRGRFIDTDSVFIVFRCFRASIFLTFEYFIYYGSPYSLINMMTLKYILNFTGIALAILVTTCELCLNCFHQVTKSVTFSY